MTNDEPLNKSQPISKKENTNWITYNINLLSLISMYFNHMNSIEIDDEKSDF